MRTAADLPRTTEIGVKAITHSSPPFPRRTIIAALIIAGAYNALYIGLWLYRSTQPQFADFFGLWSFGQCAMAQGPAVYDAVALQAFQHGLDPAFTGSYPYPYPPTFPLALAPLGLLPLAPAFTLWTAGTFALYALATLGRDWRSLRGAALLVAPTTLLAIVSGQNGFLTAALLVGGLRSLRRYPWIGGILLGLLTYKPQFVLLVPVVLLAARQWKAITSVALPWQASSSPAARCSDGRSG